MRSVRGGPGSGKTALVFQELKRALHEGEPARLIVPTATLVRHFQHELARDGEVFSPSTVATLSGFAALAADPLKAVPAGVLRALVRDVLEHDRSGEFGAVADAEGMVSTLVETIGLFENAGATPDRLSTVRRVRGYGKAFARVWTAVADRVRALGFATRPEILRAAAQNTAGLKIWFDGFAVFSPAEAELVRRLGETCEAAITVSGNDLWRQTLEWGCEDRLLTGATRRPHVTAVAAASMEREADEIARRIVYLKASGAAYGEIAVGIRDAESYVPLLRGVFERFGIPARFYFGEALRSRPAMLFLSGLIDCALNGWEFGATLDALCAHPRFANNAAFDRYDFDVRKAMPGRGTEALLALCGDERLKARLSQYFAIAEWILEKRTPHQWAERICDFAEHTYVPGVIDLPGNFTDVESLREQSFALRAWLDAVAESVGFWPENAAPLSLSDFWRVAALIVDAAEVQIPDARRDVVHVMHVYEVRQWDVRTLFLCGMTDREFPQKTLPNLLFPDVEIEMLRRAGLPLRKASDYEDDEDALFETLRGRARESLILSWPKHDAGGRRVESSRYVARLIDDGAASVREARLCRPESLEEPSARVTGRIVAPELLTALTQRHAAVTISHLEDLAQCRFKFFAGKTLGLKTRPERPQERLEARMTGLILHFALERWLEEGRSSDFVPYFEVAFDDTCRKEHLPPGYRLELERIEARRIAEQVSASEKWTALSHEVEVPVSIAFPGGVTVNGRIDRVDLLNETDCIVVDYKSGKTKNVEKFAVSPLKLQGPLYALALRDARNLNTVAMMFHAVRDDKRYGWGEVPGADMQLQPIPERWMEDAKDRTVERLTDFLAGEIRAEPMDRSQCRWCDFAATCRYEEREALVMIEGAAN